MISRKLMGRDWGISPVTAHWLYTTTVRPILSYGAIVWAGSLDKSRNLEQMRKVQRMACLMITGAMPSTPTAGMETLLGLEPIECYMKKEALAAGIRLMNNGQWRTRFGETLSKKSHAKRIDKIVNKYPELKHPQDKLTVKQKVKPAYNTVIEHRESIEKANTKPMPRDRTTINCFTDGSKTDYGTGAGFSIMGAVKTTQESIHLGDRATVYQAEIVAITSASMELIKQEVTNREINFHIDSQSAIKSLGSYITRDKTTLECKKVLNTLSKGNNDITLNWVPGHEGHMGNEVADRLAKRGVFLQTQGPGPFVPDAKCHIKTFLNNWCDVRCEETWRAREDCRQSKIFMPNARHRWSKQILKKSKTQIRILTQIVTGHANLKRHKFLMKLEESPMCDCQEGEETTIHVLAECPLHARNRWHYLGRATLKEEDLKNKSLTQILKFARASKKWALQPN